MTPQPTIVDARVAIRGHLPGSEPAAGLLPHLERIRDDELQAAQEGVQRALSAIRTELAVVAGSAIACGHAQSTLRLEKDFQALSLRMADLLDLARLRIDEGAVHSEPLMLDQAVRGAVEDVASSLRAHGVRLDVQLQADVPVTTDAARVRTIALRLLDLGVRPLEPDDRLHLRVVARDGRARLEVEAQGLAAAVEGSVGLRVCRTLAASLGARLEAGPDSLVVSLPVRALHRRAPAGVADLRFL